MTRPLGSAFQKGAFAILLMFVGSYGVLSALGGLVLHGNAVLFVAPPGAVILTWILCSMGFTRQSPVPEGTPKRASAMTQGFLTKRGKWFLAATVGLILASALVLFIWMHWHS